MKKRIAFIVLALISVIAESYTTYAKKPIPVGCLEADILIIVDWSESVQSRQSEMLGAIYEYSHSFTLSNDGIKIGILSFADSSIVRSFITADTTEINTGIADLSDDLGDYGTHTDGIPDLIQATMLRSTKERGRPPLRRFVIVISDGDVIRKDGSATEFVGMSSKLGITTFSIGIPKYDSYDDSGLKFMKSIASPNCFFLSDYESLREFLVRLNLCV